jgi:uncharacterized protein (TIGR02466 family)
MLNYYFPVPIYIEAPLVERSMFTEIDNALSNSVFKNDWQPDNDSAKTTFSKNGETNIIKKLQMKEFESFILEHATAYLNSTEQPINKDTLIISESWANTFEKEEVIGWHNHGYQPNTISGVFYHKAPVGCGRLKFKSPNPYTVSFPCHASNYNSIVNIDPELGMIVLFPSWIQHGTEPNRTKETRISIAFNLSFDYNWEKDYLC